ncbi:MAG TPA: hypothetical protein VFX25_08945 [Streptosporangiaceae bacterium]|nr:hypothetical protein [Streptosporangiaceae bacterium]
MYSSSRDDGRGGGGVAIDGTRRADAGLVRDAPGRELPRRVAGRVLALAAVRGLAGPLFFPLPFFPLPFFPLPGFPLPGFWVEPDWVTPFGLLPPDFAEADRAAVRVVPDFAEVPVPARDLLAVVRAVLVRDAVDRLAGRAGALAADDLLVAGLLAEDVRAEDRVVRLADAEVARFAAGRRAGVADADGLTADSEFAAEVRALAAVVIALVAVFTDCIAVDSVRADDVALVAALVILVAAEVTLVAADDTVRAALAGVWPADEDRVVRRAVARAGRRVLLVLRAVLRGPAERADLVVVRADDLVLVD